MIDLHSHLLPGCDDGAADRRTALAMAKMSAQDGVRIMACTPHIVPGLYQNDATGIAARVEALQEAIRQAGIDLTLVCGADVHVAPDVPRSLAAGRVPTLNGSRYFLLELPRAVVPPGLNRFIAGLIEAGFVPVLTHPERLAWSHAHYEVIEELDALGCLFQITAGSLLGAFGRNAQRMAERMLDEGRVDVLASDAHDPARRPPGLSKARDWIGARHGEALAVRLVADNPQLIIEDRPLKPSRRRARSMLPGALAAGRRSADANRLLAWMRHD